MINNQELNKNIKNRKKKKSLKCSWNIKWKVLRDVFLLMSYFFLWNFLNFFLVGFLMILNIKIGDIVIKINNKKRNKKEQKVNYSELFEYFWKVKKKKPRPNNSLNIIMNFEKKRKKKVEIFF